LIKSTTHTGGANESQVFAKEKGSNRIYAAGHNVQGQLANYATSTALSTFTEIPFNVNSPIIDIIPIITDGLGGYTIILTEDGNTYFAGQSRWDMQVIPIVVY
jgi:hypothetical protein